MTTKADLLKQLDQTEAEWNEVANAAKERGADKPGAMGDWTFVDVAGHLNGWRVRSVAQAEAAVTGEDPGPPPWPAELDADDDADLDAINQWIYDQYHDRPLDDILAEARTQWQRLRTATEAIPEADLFESGHYPWLPDDPLSDVIGGWAEHYHEEHEASIRAWLEQGA